MNVVTRGARNAFRNVTRTISIVSILGLSIGLGIVMLIAHQAVEKKIQVTLQSIGNTVRIQPAGYSGSNSVNSALTNDQLAKLRSIAHVKSVAGTLSGALQPEGTTSLPTPPGDSSNSQSKLTGPASDETTVTSLQTPFKLDCQGSKCTSGNTGLNTVGGDAPKLPANFSLPIRVIGSDAPTDPAVIDSTKMVIMSGKPFDVHSKANEAMLSADVAHKNHLKVGSTFSAYKQTFKVVAIFKSNTRTGDSTMLIPLATLQHYTKQTNLITSAVATVDSLEHLEQVTKNAQSLLGNTADVNSEIEEANKAIEPLRSVSDISMYSLAGAVFTGAIIIMLTMIMIVRERKREIGVFKALGFKNMRIMLQFMSEAVTLTILAAVIGFAIGVIGGNPVTSILVKNSAGGASGGVAFENQALSNVKNIQATLGWEVILFGFAAALLIALMASACASFIITKIRPAEVLRSE